MTTPSNFIGVSYDEAQSSVPSDHVVASEWALNARQTPRSRIHRIVFARHRLIHTASPPGGTEFVGLSEISAPFALVAQQ